MANRSTFPTTLDTFLEHYELSATEKPLIIRFQELKMKSSLTNAESDELANLTTQIRNKLITAEDFNKLQDSIVNLQAFFRDNVDGYVSTKQNEINTTVSQGKIEIQTTKDSALLSIEQKKDNIIDYMDGTTAGAIRNDLGVMGELTTTTKGNLVGAINEVNAKQVDLSPIQNDLAAHKAEDASLIKKGHVQLSSSTTSTSEILAATPKAIKAAMDRADAAFTSANNGKTDIVTVIGSPATSGDTFTQLKTHIQTSKNTIATNLTSKGQPSVGTESLNSLASKVAKVQTGIPSILYDFGYEGFSLVNGHSSGYNPKSITKKSESIVIDCSAIGGSEIGITTNDLIDFTKIKKVLIEWKKAVPDQTVNDNFKHALLISTDKTSQMNGQYNARLYGTGTLYSNFSSGLNSTLEFLDVSNVTGKNYLKIHLRNDSNTSGIFQLGIYRIYLITGE